MANRYRKPPETITDFTARMNQNVGKLTRVPRSVATGVDKGSLVFNGGYIEVDPGQTDTQFENPVFWVTGNPSELTNLILLDNFDRNQANSWANVSTGSINGTSYAMWDWLTNGGSAGDYNVVYTSGFHGTGTINITTGGSARYVYANGVANALDDMLMDMTFNLPAMPTASNMAVALLPRFRDVANQYLVQAMCNSTGTIDIVISTNVANVTTQVASVTGVETFVAGQDIHFECQIVGFEIQARVWVGDAKPDWQIDFIDTNNTFATGLYGLRFRTSSSLLPLPFVTNVTNVSVYVPNTQTGIGSFESTNRVFIGRNRSNGLSDFSNSTALEFNDAPIDTSIPTNSFMIRDRFYGSLLVDASIGRGLSDPQIPYTWFDPSTPKSTTSATFTNHSSIFWHAYHPFLMVVVLVNIPSGTTYDVRVNESGHNQQAILTGLTNTFSYQYLFVNRDNTSDVPPTGFFIGQNGYELNFDLEWRRTAGTGTGTMLIAFTYGFDQL